MKKKQWYIIAPVIIALLIFFDQITKYWARRDLADEGFNIIKGFFGLKLVSNKGAAWGIFQGRIDILSIISIVVLIFLVLLFIKIPEDKKYHILRVLLLCVMAGALGNLLDRFYQGFVTDFLYFELIDFPVFNVADCYITFAMFLFAFLLIFKYKDSELEFFSFKKIFGIKDKNDTNDTDGEDVYKKEEKPDTKGSDVEKE
ncbi:MAG: signal peptidase II [Lachnospiraceae bacterium]|nr:signal peptidase II [Lachnospiraceae bacterium]